MEILEQPIFPLFLDELPWSRPVSHANQQALPASAEARAMTVGSGRQCSLLLEESSPLGQFSKILLESSHWTNSEEFCYVWNRLDTKFECSAFQLTPLEQSTDGNESLLWRTPNASDVTGGPMDGERRLEQGHHLNLVEQAASPKLWPTPRKEGYDAQGKGHGDLVYEVKNRLLPTPTVQDGANNAGPSQMDRNSLSLNATFGGSLNPRFVEELMGFEIDHTALRLSVTPSCPSKPTPSSKRSRRSEVF